ncbi:2'-5' RNA ligase family protein [Wenyingzhuangia sp. IMCC45467]
MDLKTHYQNLFDESMLKIASDDYQIDRLIADENDFRYGITLVIRPSEVVKNKIQLFLEELKEIEPHQYYYHNSDIHITVMSIISCYNGFEVKNINVKDYINIINNSLKGFKTSKIQLKGLTASPSCIMVQGFMDNNSINNFRDRLREKFKNSALEQSIDKRYAIQTAHSTVVRFSESFSKKEAFFNIVEKYKDEDFGTFEVKSIELVANDWYHKEKKVRKLATLNI